MTGDFGYVDSANRAWSAERVQELERAFSRRVVRWSRRGDEIYSRPDGGVSFKFRLKMGGHQVKALTPEESVQLRRLLSELIDQRFGPIVSRSSEPADAVLAAIEDHWVEEARARALGVASEDE